VSDQDSLLLVSLSVIAVSLGLLAAGATPWVLTLTLVGLAGTTLVRKEK
jgi:hypothetical protein